ncbi:hypothetical protein OH491_27440 (plasmid) [Termitidicoccus mucosus]|uniref:Uncharacterized protein n=1 Tax=Termitidicoccus mucosus TaxID=1184151 RepID=A0A178IPS0_9BACT|nr:hypothetical protein AW736_26280 [Opitutaceae bacterium TSB47]
MESENLTRLLQDAERRLQEAKFNLLLRESELSKARDARIAAEVDVKVAENLVANLQREMKAKHANAKN